MKAILFATASYAKKKLFTPIFAEYGLTCITLPDIGLAHASPSETGATPAENALLKARTFHSARWPLVFGDDTGLEVDALNGEPGLKARRWNGRFDSDVDDETCLAYLLKRLDGVPLEKRTARFVAALVLIDPNGHEHIHHIVAPFQIALHPLCPITPGSPISAVRMGPDDDIAHRSQQLAQEMERWGVLARYRRSL